jgi:hypothetical protein
MSDKEKLNNIRSLISQAKHDEARKILETITTRDPLIRVDVLLIFLVVLDHVTENDQLLEVANEGLRLTKQTGNDNVYGYFLGKKSLFLLSKLSNMVHREKNLKLSANVFKWIDFSLERDKKEHEAIIEERKKLEKAADEAMLEVEERAKRSSDHYFRGHMYSEVAEFYCSKCLLYKLDFQKGGRRRSMIANIYFVRRWNLDKFLYDRTSRKKIESSEKQCYEYFNKAIEEFRIGGKNSEEAHAIYNLAVKFKIFYRFRKATQFLARAKIIAEELQEKYLLNKIAVLEKETADKNRHLRDWVTELGLDMP